MRLSYRKDRTHDPRTACQKPTTDPHYAPASTPDKRPNDIP